MHPYSRPQFLVGQVGLPPLGHGVSMLSSCQQPTHDQRYWDNVQPFLSYWTVAASLPKALYGGKGLWGRQVGGWSGTDETTRCDPAGSLGLHFHLAHMQMLGMGLWGQCGRLAASASRSWAHTPVATAGSRLGPVFLPRPP